MNSTLKLASDLIALASITPNDAGCQEILIARLKEIGFVVERLDFGNVRNFWARYGNSAPLVVFAGHTDVVPPGNPDQWISPPFSPEVREGFLYGRGAADMKGSLAAMITAIEGFLAETTDFRASIGMLITSDEEGPAIDGTVKVMNWLSESGQKIDYCLVGEPSSEERAGDVVKNGRRGSLSARVKFQGTQGHVAYPHLADNPIHGALSALGELTAMKWDAGNEDFPPTTFQISNIRGGTGAENVIPGELEVWANFRFSTEITPDRIKNGVNEILRRCGQRFTTSWTLHGSPFLTPGNGDLARAVRKAVREISGFEPEFSTAGGTSDGRFIAPTGSAVVELGPCNKTIHRVDECVRVEDLDILSRMYRRILENLLAPG